MTAIFFFNLESNLLWFRYYDFILNLESVSFIMISKTYFSI